MRESESDYKAEYTHKKNVRVKNPTLTEKIIKVEYISIDYWCFSKPNRNIPITSPIAQKFSGEEGKTYKIKK